MLDAHVPAGYYDSEEVDLRDNVWSRWHQVAQLAEDTSDSLAEVQGPFKRILNRDIREFVKVYDHLSCSMVLKRLDVAAVCTGIAG